MSQVVVGMHAALLAMRLKVANGSTTLKPYMNRCFFFLGFFRFDEAVLVIRKPVRQLLLWKEDMKIRLPLLHFRTI